MVEFNKEKKFYYITTPLYYVNDRPHIGHAYTTIAADVYARYKRMKGLKVFFLTGTDEHGQKVEGAARNAGKSPKEFVDSIALEFKKLWELLNIKYDYFIRTTDPEHEKAVLKFFNKVNDAGDIYLGEYKGYYCVPCETYYTASQLIEADKCPDCRRPVQLMTEPSYFFKLSKYEKKLLEHIERNKEFIEPEARKNEVINFIRQGLQDLSISRTSTKWGVQLPKDKKHVLYVWFDALLNYITAPGYGSDSKKFNSIWPADLHLMGKEIVRFHAVIWPAMLLSAGIELPKRVFGHGWWTVEGQKMSKSLGNMVDPIEVSRKYSVDAFRYFLLREVPFGSDGDYSEKALVQRINSDLADDLGNLLNRTIAMIQKYFNGEIPEAKKLNEKELQLKEFTLKKAREADLFLEKLEFSKSLYCIWEIISSANSFINEKKPWELAKKTEKEELASVLNTLAETLRVISLLLYPYIPETAEKIQLQLGIKSQKFDEAFEWPLIPSKTKTGRIEILFRKVQ
ncbi:MAG: methionine--tRNA ligase [Candidatus Diapherotrites archaeon]